MSSSQNVTALRGAEGQVWTADDAAAANRLEEYLYERPHLSLDFETVTSEPPSGYVVLGPRTAKRVVSIHKLDGRYALLVGPKPIYEATTLSAIEKDLRQNLWCFLLAVGKCHLEHLRRNHIQEIIPVAI